jgi:hypothetical protein
MRQTKKPEEKPSMLPSGEFVLKVEGTVTQDFTSGQPSCVCDVDHIPECSSLTISGDG